MAEYATKNIEINQGSTWTSDFFVVIDPVGAIVDFTGKTFKMQIRKNIYASTSILEMTDADGQIVVTNGTLTGVWNVSTAYAEDEIVTYSITQEGTTFTVYFSCDIANTGETPSLTSTYWSIFKQINFQLSAETTEALSAGVWVYDLEVTDPTVTPEVVQKILKGNFTIVAEVTR